MSEKQEPQIVYQHRWMSCHLHQLDIPLVRWDDGVMAVPITTDRKILLIEEFAPAYDKRTLFLPAGGLQPNEEPTTAINRELQEEAGFKAGRLDYLGQINPLVKYIHATITLYLARELTPSRLATGDEPWPVTIEYQPLADFEVLLGSGRLRDANVIAALYLARTFLEHELKAEAAAPDDVENKS